MLFMVYVYRCFWVDRGSTGKCEGVIILNLKTIINHRDNEKIAHESNSIQLQCTHKMST